MVCFKVKVVYLQSGSSVNPLGRLIENKSIDSLAFPARFFVSVSFVLFVCLSRPFVPIDMLALSRAVSRSTAHARITTNQNTRALSMSLRRLNSDTQTLSSVQPTRVIYKKRSSIVSTLLGFLLGLSAAGGTGYWYLLDEYQHQATLVSASVQAMERHIRDACFMLERVTVGS
jgi:hypothetical protein